MFKISGKQQFGAVWLDETRVVEFTRGIAYTSDQTAAEQLKALGYTVEGETDEAKKGKDTERKKSQ
jgi:hypothetical protein